MRFVLIAVMAFVLAVTAGCAEKTAAPTNSQTKVEDELKTKPEAEAKPKEEQIEKKASENTTQEPEAEVKPDVKLKNKITEDFKNADITNVEKLEVNADMSGKNDGKFLVLATLTYNAPGRFVMLNSSVEVLREVFKNDAVSESVLFWKTPEGNTRWMKITLNSSDASKIDWTKTDPNDLPKVVTKYQEIEELM